MQKPICGAVRSLCLPVFCTKCTSLFIKREIRAEGTQRTSGSDVTSRKRIWHYGPCSTRQRSQRRSPGDWTQVSFTVCLFCQTFCNHTTVNWFMHQCGRAGSTVWLVNIYEVCLITIETEKQHVSFAVLEDGVGYHWEQERTEQRFNQLRLISQVTRLSVPLDNLLAKLRWRRRHLAVLLSFMCFSVGEDLYEIN